MSKRPEHRRQQAIARKKEKRANKSRVAREPRQQPQVSLSGTLATAAGWPVGPCHVSMDWEGQPALIHVSFSRANAEGVHFACLLTLDCATAGVTEVDVRGPISEAGLLSLVADRAADDGMIECEPGLVVALVAAAERVGGTAPTPASLADARQLFGNITEADSPYPVGDLAGRSTTSTTSGSSADGSVATNGWFTSLRKRLIGA